MNRVKKGLLFIMAVVLLTGCSMPATKIYSLSLPPAKNAGTPTTSASVSVIVHSPRHLSQPYMVFRSSPYELTISSYARWDTPPDEIVKGAFRDSLSSSGAFAQVRAGGLAGHGAYLLEINVRNFERLDAGDASFAELVLDAVLLSPEGREIHRGVISKRTALDKRDFPGLARALSASLSEGVAEMISAISTKVQDK